MPEDQSSDAAKQPETPEQPKITGKPKTFNLKQIDTQLLVITRQNHNAVFSSILSTIAIDRYGYPITQNSQFVLNDRMDELTIQELEPQVPVAKAEAPNPDVPAEPATGAVTA